MADVEHALYEDKVLMRMLGMRRTMFVVPIEFAPVVQAACTRAIAAQERRRTIQIFGQAGIAGDIGAWLGVLEEQTFEALDKRGKATAQQLSGRPARVETTGSDRFRKELRRRDGRRAPRAVPAFR